MISNQSNGAAAGSKPCRAAAVVALLSIAFLCAGLPRDARAYPDAEVTGTAAGFPPFDLGVSSTFSGFLLTSDRRLVVSYGQALGLGDAGHFALEATQPPALTDDDDNDGTLAGIGYSPSRNEIVAPQTDGDIVFFDLDDLSATPPSMTVAADSELGPVAIDDDTDTAYVADNTARRIHIVDLNNRTFRSTGELGESFSFTDAVFVDETNEAYFATDVGTVFYMSAGGTAATSFDVAAGADLAALDANTDGTAIYIAESAANDPKVYRVRTATHSLVNTMTLEYNSELSDIEIAGISGRSPYAYVAGASGVSVIDTGSDDVLDFDSSEVGDQPIATSYTAQMLAASGADDGYVYIGYATGDMGVLTSNPFVAISSLSYSGGDDSLGQGESFTVTFSSDMDGTYEIRSGGSVSAGGNLLTDDAGETSGSITAGTDTSVTVNYDDNSSSFDEGVNDLWVFQTTGGERGRYATTLTVDTPPPNVVINSTGFGSGRIYIDFDRIDVADMSSYNIYIDADEDAVLAMEDATASVAQAGSGTTQTAEVGGLVNGTTYFIAMEAVDAGGNASETRTNTFADGTPASGMPQRTVGPVELTGEGGCGLAAGIEGDWTSALFFIASIVLLLGFRGKKTRGAAAALIFLTILLAAGRAGAGMAGVEERAVTAVDGYQPSPQWWSVEVKTGFWMPKNSVLDRFFTPCCNMITRVQGGLLIHRRYGFEMGAGVLYKTARALGADTGDVSQDRFSLLLIPLDLSFAWRMDYTDWRYFLPYVKTGTDYVIFRQGLQGASTTGGKFGMHGVFGFQFNIGEIADANHILDEDFGINDLFLTLEAEYRWIDNFGGTGLDLSGQLYSIGLLFEF